MTFSPSQSGSSQAHILGAGEYQNSVSCVSTSLCVSVDDSGDEVAFNPQSGAITKSSDIDGDYSLASVSCLSGSECVVVDDTGAELTFNPQTGSVAESGAVSTDGLSALSCPSSSVCVAVGDDGAETAFNPGTGTKLHSGDLDGSDDLLSLACPQTTSCIAGDDNGDEISFNPTPGSGSFTVVSDEQIDAGWTLGTASCMSATACVLADNYGEGYLINPTIASPTPTDGFPADYGLQSMMCLSSECIAASDGGDVVVFNSSFDDSNDVFVDVGGSLESVSCPSASSCTAVDDVGYEVTYDPANPNGATRDQIDSSGSLYAVACPASGECVAVDSAGNTYEFSPTSPSGVTERNIDADTLWSITCPQTSLCVAGDNAGRIVIFDPLTNATPTLLDVDTGHGIASISCPSSTQCTAVDNDGNEITFNPGSSAVPSPVPLEAGAWGNGVSCISTTLCVMVTNYGRAIGFNPQSGEATSNDEIDPDHALMGIDCPSSSLCEAVDYGGNIYEGSPTNPAGWTATHLGSSTAAYKITCAPTSICVAVDLTGNSYLGQGGTWTPVPSAGSAPTISGSAVAGSTLTESHGSWSYSPSSYGYQWEDCNAQGTGCNAISGATGQTYRLTASDVGHTVVVVETAANGAGSGQASQSAATAVVATTASSAIVKARSSALDVLVTVSCGGSGTCAGSVELKSNNKKHASLGAKSYSLSGGATVTITVPLSGAGQKLLAEAAGYKMRVLVALTGSGDATGSVTLAYHRFSGSAIAYQLATAATYTEVASLAARHLPAHTSIRLSCSGSGCPFSSKQVKPRRSTENLSKWFAGAKLSDAAVTVRLTDADYVGKVFVIKIHGGGKAATFKNLCAPPGRGAQRCR